MTKHSQDNPSTNIGCFAAHAAVPHSGAKPKSGHLDSPGASETTAGDTYADCIYGRDDEQNGAIGIVEIVETQEKKPFKSLEELLIILNAAEAGAVIKWER